jgi:crossover junction endodeoxyribonuclease RuvC
MLVVGIDPGTARTGYGFVQQSADGTLRAVEFGVITTAASVALPDRLQQISDRLSELLALHRPQGAAVERLFYRRNVASAMSVGQARGVALLTLAQAGLAVHEYTPVQVKQAICGYGRAGKVQMQRMVQTLLQMPKRPSPDDVADALAVAICHLHSQRPQGRPT